MKGWALISWSASWLSKWYTLLMIYYGAICCFPKTSRVFMPNLANSSEIVNFKLCQQQSSWCCSWRSYILLSSVENDECTTTFWTTFWKRNQHQTQSSLFFVWKTTNFLNKSNKSFWAQLTLSVKFFFQRYNQDIAPGSLVSSSMHCGFWCGHPDDSPGDDVATLDFPFRSLG